jgi:hypothetical protein
VSELDILDKSHNMTLLYNLTKDLRLDKCPSRDSNGAPPEYKFDVLPLEAFKSIVGKLF